MGPGRKRTVAAAACLLGPLLAFLPAASPYADAGQVATAAFPGDNGLIAFVSDREGDPDIYVMNADGSRPKRLTSDLRAESEPTWSPDGSHLAFARRTSNVGNVDVFTMNADGTGISQLTSATGANIEPTWSPDGSRIAFASDRGGDDDRYQIWVMEADGTDETLMINAPDGTARAPSWSSDGTRIAYVGAQTGTLATGLYAADGDGTGSVELVLDPGGVSGPDWSPDVSRIAYASGGSGDEDLYVIGADGADNTALTDNTVDDLHPAWSPDGSFLAFTREGALGPDVWTIDPTSLSEGQLTVDEAGEAIDDSMPSWQPAMAVSTVTVTPASAQQEVGQDHDVIITARDGDGAASAGRPLLVEVSGTTSSSSAVTTDSDGRATFTLPGDEVGTDTLIVCADTDLDTSCGPGEPAATATVLWTLPGPVDSPRLAFTDDADALYRMTVERTDDNGDDVVEFEPRSRPRSYATDLSGFDAGPTHEGEAGGEGDNPPVFVSTRDEPHGEVYAASTSGDVDRVTCDTDMETHPAINLRNGSVAYASNADGDWDVYVSSPPPPPPVPRVAPFGRDPAPPDLGTPRRRATACSDSWATVNVTQESPGQPARDDLWPTWTYDAFQGQAIPTGLVFSSAAAGELPDLYQAPTVGTGFRPPAALTSTPAVAETQPAAMVFEVVVGEDPLCDPDIGSCPIFEQQGWVAFVTSELRSSGTLAFLSPEDPTDVTFPAFYYQATEPAWSTPVNPRALAVTTIEDDPYGDIAISDLALPTGTAGAGTSAPAPTEPATVRRTANGVGENHPFWLQEFTTNKLTGRAVLVFTSRSDDNVRAGSRRLHADVSDVLAADGSQRRTIRRERDIEDGQVTLRYDESGPAYSPDGQQVVYSRNNGQTGRSDPDGGGDFYARVLLESTADGDDDAVPLLPTDQRDPQDIDVDPVWSPDGTKVAFVRVDYDKGGLGPPGVWVYDLDTRVAIPISGGDDAIADLSPSWAPDSRHLVLARSRFGSGDPNDAARRWDQDSGRSGPELVLVDVSTPEAPATELDSCSDGCSVRGRSPAWSPDGTTIVYEYDGDLNRITVPKPCCAGPVTAVDGPFPVTGVDGSTDPDTPTPTRSDISMAQDPAWNPEGTEIAFAGQSIGQPDSRGIWAVAPDGTGLRLITDEPGPETEPAWQGSTQADLKVTVAVAPSPVLVGAPMAATFTVRNLGTSTAHGVDLGTTFAPGAVLKAPGQPPACRFNGTGCDFGELAVGASRTYQVRIRHPEAILGVATGTVTAERPVDPQLVNNIASALYRVMAADLKVRIKVDEPVGYVGGLRTAVVTIRNIGADPLFGIDLSVAFPVEASAFVPPILPMQPPPASQCVVDAFICFVGILLPGEHRSYRIGLDMVAEGEVQLGAEVGTTTPEVDTTNNVSVVDLKILQPVIRVLPSVAPPGRVVLAYGEKMPPGSLIDLGWSQGLTIEPGPFLVKDDGTVRAPMLVVRHDLLGARLLTATSTEDLFTPVDGQLLVVPRTLTPPNFNGRG